VLIVIHHSVIEQRMEESLSYREDLNASHCVNSGVALHNYTSFIGFYSHADSSSLLANCSIERFCTDNLMPKVPISCLPASRVDPEVQGLNVNCPQPGSSRATYRPPPMGRV